MCKKIEKLEPCNALPEYVIEICFKINEIIDVVNGKLESSDDEGPSHYCPGDDDHNCRKEL